MDEPKQFNLENELEMILRWHRDTALNEEQHKEAASALFCFSAGLLCGLKLSKGGQNA